MTAVRWLLVADAAARVARDPRTLRRWVASGDLPVKMGRVREDELLRVDREMRAKRAAGKRSPRFEVTDELVEETTRKVFRHLADGDARDLVRQVLEAAS